MDSLAMSRNVSVCVWTIWIDVKLLPLADVFRFSLFLSVSIAYNQDFLNCQFNQQGAAGNVIVLQPTKTAMTFCDIDLGRWIDVPALLFRIWHPAKPRTGMTIYVDTCIYLDFTFSQNWGSHWFGQVAEFSFVFSKAGISSLRGTRAFAAWVLSISWWISSSTELSTG